MNVAGGETPEFWRNAGESWGQDCWILGSRAWESGLLCCNVSESSILRKKVLGPGSYVGLWGERDSPAKSCL
jgi:hypothetical protein